MKEPWIGFLIIGDELLDGTRVDLHTQWMSSQLKNLGLTVRRALSVRDTREEIQGGLNLFTSQSNRPMWLFLTGGLGPTSDDLTTETVADHFGWKLKKSPEAEAWLIELCQRLKLPFGPGQEKQCYFPEGATVLSNSNGTAAGFLIEKNDLMIVVLPGPPNELRPMFLERVIPELKTRMSESQHLRTRVLQTFFVPESQVAIWIQKEDELIQEWKSQGIPIRIGYREKRPRIFVKVEWKGREHDEKGERVFATIHERLKSAFVVQGDHEDLEDEIISLLVKNGWTLSIAESCTGGLLASRLTAVPGVSAIFGESFVTYSNESKVRELGVDPELLRREGAVSEACAKAMAQGVCQRTGARFGLAITGVAGPEGGTEEKPVGTVFMAFCDAENGSVYGFHQRFRGDRFWIRQGSTEVLLARFLQYLFSLS